MVLFGAFLNSRLRFSSSFGQFLSLVGNVIRILVFSFITGFFSFFASRLSEIFVMTAWFEKAIRNSHDSEARLYLLI